MACMTVDLESIVTPAMGLRLKLLLEMSGKRTSGQLPEATSTCRAFSEMSHAV